MNRKILLASLLSFYHLLLFAQPTTYVADLAALKNIIEKTPSYKTQIKRDKRVAYEKIYDRLVADTLGETNDYRYFYNLAQLLFPLRDNHLAFYQLPNYNQFKTNETIEQCTRSKAFPDYPTARINLDSLRLELVKKPLDSIEGIYHYDKFYAVGVYSTTSNNYTAVVLNSTVNIWQPGQIAFRLYGFAPGLFKAIYSHPLTKNYMLYPIEKYRNHSLVNSWFYSANSNRTYSKDTGSTGYVRVRPGAARFELKNVTADIQYLRVKSFQLNKATVLRSQVFYDSVKPLLKARDLIFDLRDNEGGAKKATINYYKLVKQFARRGKVYVSLNNETISQAERLTIRLQKLRNVVTIGQTTKGMLAYGSNYGKTLKLPSAKFAIYPTDMKGSKKLLSYEDSGIEPDMVLRTDRDWIDQVIAIIKRNS